MTNRELAETVINRLKKSGLILATAESCTGGLAGKYLTDIPGASSVYSGGVISYTDDVKQRLLGVSSDTLEHLTAVSRQTAHEMALGIRERTGADIGISVTGFAGPNSDDTGRPVGLVYIALDTIGFSFCKELHLSGDREQIRELAVCEVFYELLDFLED